LKGLPWVSIGIDDWKLRRVCQPTTAASSAPARRRKPQVGVAEGLGQGFLGCSQSRNLGVAPPETPRRVSAEYEQYADGTHASYKEAIPAAFGGRTNDDDNPRRPIQRNHRRL